jgi:cell division protein FtsB
MRIAPVTFSVKWGTGMRIMALFKADPSSRAPGERSPRAGSWARVAARAGVAGATAALALLAVLLVGQGLKARAEGLGAVRQAAAVDREIERLRRENRALRDEVRALESDPVYVESLLRRWRMAGADERVVD